MKRIKKLAVVLLLIITSVFSFGCWKKDDSFKYKFFSQEALDWHWISDMPTLPDGEDVRCGGGKRNTSFYCTLEENTYREYIETVYTYLKDKFQYVGYRNQNYSGWSFDFIKGNNLSDFISEREDDEFGKITEVVFIYGNEVFQSAGDTCLNWRGIRMTYSEEMRIFNENETDFAYNTVVGLFWTVHTCDILLKKEKNDEN